MKVERFREVPSHTEGGRGLLYEDDQVAVLLTVSEDPSVPGWRWSVESLVPRRQAWLDGVQPSEMLAVRHGKSQATLVISDLMRETALRAQASSEGPRRVSAKEARGARVTAPLRSSRKGGR